MTAALLRLRAVEPMPGFRLNVAWDQGEPAVVDLAPILDHGTVFLPIKDPALFERVRIGPRSRSVEWPEPTDEDGCPLLGLDAETLLTMAREQRALRYVGRLVEQDREKTARRPT